MELKGKLHRVTDLKKFVASFVKTGGKPTEGFAPMGKTRVHLATDLPAGKFGGSLPPSMSFKTDSNSVGEFSFSVPDGFKGFRGQIIAFRTSTMAAPLPGMPPIPVLDPIYRCAPFKFSDVSSQEQATVQKIYIAQETTPNDSGISQQELNAEISGLKSKLALDSLKATILSNRVSVHATKSGGDVKFSAFVRGSTSDDLERVIEVKAGEIDIDLPGPDFIVGLCVDEDEIESQIRKGLSGLSKKISQTLLAEFEKKAPGVENVAAVSVWRTRFVQTGTKTIKVPGTNQTVQVPVMSVVPDAAAGVPRKLY
ncbi:hypothetical protein [Mycobacterium sp. 3519A]|uniref:hypothetical protein n=1 Tax=Mycobacterium sp. 3519A TaxID=2057184 RepID=UPI000C7E6B67|nr:hypothetical protein [Mycobacterium sp. 3519A]